MVTKRTRLLSIVTTAIMLVSMLACFVIPASAETTALDELKAKYDILDPANFEGLEGTPIEDTRATIAGYIEQYNATDDATMKETLVSMAQEVDAGVTEALTGKVKADAEVRYAQKGYYEALGFTGATVYLISEVEDWKAISADDTKTFSGVTLKITNDIDFSEAGAVGPLVPSVKFAGTLDGQNHKLINMTVTHTGSDGAVICSQSGTGAVIKNLGIEGGTFRWTKVANSGSNYGVGTFVGYGGGNTKILNCWSTMDIEADIGDGKAGLGGFVGYVGTTMVIDSCFFGGKVTNKSGMACDFVGYGANVTWVNNCIGAGTLSGNCNDATAMVAQHPNMFESYSADRDALLHNSYAIGHSVIRYRGGTTLDGIPDQSMSDFYGNEPYVDATYEKYCVASSLEEAAWKVNNGFVTRNQETQTHFLDVEDGKLGLITDGSKTLKKVTFTGDVDQMLYLHGGATLNLVTDLGFESGIEEINVTEGYESAINETFDLTVPAADITVEVIYSDDASLAAAKEKLLEYKSKLDAVDLDLFKDESGDLEWWYNEYLPEVLAGDSLADVEDALYMYENDLTIEFKDGVYPVFSEYEAYDYFNDANKWAITTPADWLAAVEMGSAADVLTAEFHLTNDIDFGVDCEPFYPLAWATKFEGKIYGHGYSFKNINIINKDNVDSNKYGTALISVAGNVTLDNLGIASGKVTSNATSTYGGLCAAFVGYKSNGVLTVNKCWNGADVIGPNGKYTAVGALMAWSGHNDYTAEVRVNGFYNIGTLNAGTGVESCAGVIASNNIGHGHSGIFNVFNAGEVIGSLRHQIACYNYGANCVTKNFASTDANIGNDFHVTDSATLRAPVALGSYETGEIGYLMNQGTGVFTGEDNTSYNPVGVFVSTPVYFTMNEAGEVVYGKDDGSDQIRKVSLTGSVLKDIYAVPGDKIVLSEIVSGAEFAMEEGQEDLLVEGVLTVPAADVNITVTGGSVDLESYEAGKTALAAFVADYASVDPAILANGADLTALLTKAQAALDADAAESTEDTKKAIIAVASETASFAPAAMAEGYYVPYSKKDTLFKDVAAGSNYGIYDAADWAAFVNAGKNAGITTHLMKDVTLEKNAAVLGTAQFSGIFDGHGNELTVDITTSIASNNWWGIFGWGNSTVKNLTVNGSVTATIGTADAPVTANTHVAIFSGGSGSAYVDNCVNNATLTATCYGSGRVWVAPFLAETGLPTNCVNNGDIYAYGAAATYSIGGILGRSNNQEPISDCTNNGDIYVEINEAKNAYNYYTYVGGICGYTAGAGLKNVKNTGDITVLNASRAVVGGIQGIGNGAPNDPLEGYFTNEGDITVTNAKKGDVCYVGGIFGNSLWPMVEGTVLSNSGNITVDGCNAMNGFHVGGIAGNLHADTVAFSAANTGNIWVGGNTAAAYCHVAAKVGFTSLEIGGESTGTVTLCAHENYSSTDDLVNAVVNHECDDCSYYWQTEMEGVDAEYLLAKAELEALVAKLEALMADLFTNGADMTAALNDAKAVLAADNVESNATTMQAIKDEAAKDDVVPVLKEDAKVPYSKKAAYAEYLAADNADFGIYEKEDWIQLTEDFLGKQCALNLYVMKDVDFNNTNMKPLSYGSGVVCNAKIYGQGHTFKNIKIEMEGGTNQYQGVALIGAMQNAEIHDLGVTGNIYNTSTSTSARTAVFNGGANAGGSPLIKNCWSSVTVKGPSDNRGRYLAVFCATPNIAVRIENCINYGTVETTSTGGGASVFYPYGAQATMKNNLDLGTITGNGSGVVGAITSHHNGLQNIVFSNTYSTGIFWGMTHTFNAAEVDASATINGQAITEASQVENAFHAASAAEAAWRATNGANGAVFYKLDDVKGVTYGTATDRVQKITFTGDIAAVYYLNNGSTITLADVADNATFSIGGVAIDGATYTVPNADVTINVESGSTVDLIAYAAAKAELEALVAKFSALNADLFTNGADITAAKDAAVAVLAADAESTDTTKQAIIDEAAKADVVPALKADAKVPYSKKALYAEYLASDNKTFGIYAAEDWLAIVRDNAGGNQYYVMNDVDFSEVESMLPLGYNGNTGLTGLLDGQGHAFLNINIVAAASTNWRTGVSLVSGMNGGTIRNLGLTGNVTNTATEATFADGANTRIVLTAAFSAGKNNGAAWTIENCWSDVHVKGPSTATAGLAVFNAYASANDVIKNCINYGTVESTTNGSAAVYYSAASAAAAVNNCINLGDFITTGPAAAVILHSNQASLYTNSYSVGTNNIYLRDSATYDNANMVEAGEAAWKATNGAAGTVYYKLDDAKGVTYGTATDRVQKVEFTGDAEAIAYLNNGSTITLADIHEDATFSIGGVAIDGATYTVPNADVVITVADNNPDCEHGLGKTAWVEGSNTHIFVCGECGETVGEAESCEGYLTWTEDDGAKTHSATCTECGHTYTETCVGTEKFDATDCTKDHWYEFECDRENETIPGSGADAHVWGEWTTEGATEGYRRHECENCDQFEEELLPLAAPVIVITTNTAKAGATGVEFTVTLTEATVKGGTITLTLPVWAKNVALVAGANVTVDGLTATITGEIAAGSVLLTGTYDIDILAGETLAITATAADVKDANNNDVVVAAASADAAIDVIVGDAKVDGTVDLIDAIAVLRGAVGLDTEVNVANGDIDLSGALTADDAVLIVRWWLGDPTYQGPAMGI